MGCDGLLCFRRCTGRCQIGGFQYGNSKLRKGQGGKHALRMLIAAKTRSDEKCSLTLFLQIQQVPVSLFLRGTRQTHGAPWTSIEKEQLKDHVLFTNVLIDLNAIPTMEVSHWNVAVMCSVGSQSTLTCAKIFCTSLRLPLPSRMAWYSLTLTHVFFSKILWIMNNSGRSGRRAWLFWDLRVLDSFWVFLNIFECVTHRNTLWRCVGVGWCI